MRTPWGMSDYVVDYGNGIKFYGTPSHGGFKIPKKLNDQIPEYMRNENQWYEEDCEWAIPVVAFPEKFNSEDRELAHSTFKNYFWQAYERFFGVEIPVGESYSKEKYFFIEENKNNYVVISAVSSDRFKEMVECYAVRGGRNHDGRYASKDEIHILIPLYEYRNNKSIYSFVVNDPTKYQKCPK